MVALILILFRDGLEVEEEMLQQRVAPAVPQAGARDAADRGAGGASSRTRSPTSAGRSRSCSARCCRPPIPVLSSTVVTNPRVPRLIRHSLNLESGLNDGLALPAVLAFTAAAETRRRLRLVASSCSRTWASACSRGCVVAFVASRLMPRDASARARRSAAHQKALYALGVAFAAYGAAVLPPEGNGFIAVFVCAIAFGIWRPDVRECFEARSEDMIEVVKLGVFLVFGAIFTFDGLFEDGWAAVAIAAVHAARRAAGGRVRGAGGQRATWTPPARPSWPGSGRRAWPR